MSLRASVSEMPIGIQFIMPGLLLLLYPLIVESPRWYVRRELPRWCYSHSIVGSYPKVAAKKQPILFENFERKMSRLKSSRKKSPFSVTRMVTRAREHGRKYLVERTRHISFPIPKFTADASSETDRHSSHSDGRSANHRSSICLPVRCRLLQAARLHQFLRVGHDYAGIRSHRRHLHNLRR